MTELEKFQDLFKDKEVRLIDGKNLGLLNKTTFLMVDDYAISFDGGGLFITIQKPSESILFRDFTI
jgi:hypothetical protein